MTLIQPNKQHALLNLALIALGMAVTGAVIALIFVYNQTVKYTQGASVFQENATRLQAQNSELKSATFALLSPERLAAVAAGQGMSSGGAPRYITTATWVAASHF